MYIRTNQGLGMVRRGRGMGWIDANSGIHPDPNCGPSASYSVGANVGPWPGQLTAPQYAVYQAAAWQPGYGTDKTPNAVSNLLRLIPSVDASGATIPTLVDLDGSVIDPASLIAKSMQALALQQCYPWQPGIQPVIDGSGKVKQASKVSGSNFYNDNIRPGRFPWQSSGPADIVQAANSSNSSSSGPPGAGGANIPGIDPSRQRDIMYQALASLPFERLPLQALPFWQPGVDYSKLMTDTSVPSTPPPPPAAPVSQQTVTSDHILSGPLGNPVTPFTAAPPSLVNQPGQIPLVVTSAPDLPPGLKPAPNQPTRRTGGSRPATNLTPMVAPQTPAQAAANASATTVTTAPAATGVLDSAMSWVQNNPLIAAGIAAGLFFVFAHGGKR